MQLYANLDKLKPEVVVEHRGERIAFSASVFTRNAFTKYDVFEYINKYWSKMPLAAQDKIWFIYSEIGRGFDQIFGADELFQFLNTQIKALIPFHDLRALQSSLSRDPTVVIPESVKPEFIHDPESNNTREKTYVHSEYMELAAVSLFMRCLVPIWGEYINATRAQSGVDYKEQQALQLLTGTGIMESDAIKKLLVYINDNTKEKHNNPEKILKGVSSEDMNFLLLALVCVRRLCVADLRGTDPSAHIVSKTFNFVYQRMFNPSKTDNPVKEKPFGDTNNSTDQNKHSILESYRKRTELSLSDVVSIQHGWRDVYLAADRLAPSLLQANAAMLEETLATTAASAHERIGDPQLVIASWVFKTVHVPGSIYYLKNQDAWRALGAAEASLWDWGFHYLALLVSAHQIVGNEEIHVSPIDSKSQIPQELREEIYQHYPYVWSNLRRTGTQTSQEVHGVLYAIDKVVDDLVANAWRITAAPWKIEQALGSPRRKLPIPSTIKIELAKLILEVEHRRS